jgi:hypothetical protein
VKEGETGDSQERGGEAGKGDRRRRRRRRKDDY